MSLDLFFELANQLPPPFFLSEGSRPRSGPQSERRRWSHPPTFCRKSRPCGLRTMVAALRRQTGCGQVRQVSHQWCGGESADGGNEVFYLLILFILFHPLELGGRFDSVYIRTLTLGKRKCAKQRNWPYPRNKDIIALIHTLCKLQAVVWVMPAVGWFYWLMSSEIDTHQSKTVAMWNHLSTILMILKIE